MSHIPYPFEQIRPSRYIFFSDGKTRIKKVVVFIPLQGRNMVNLGFGDLLPDDTVDDKATSNNGDIRKVLSTVVQILKHFTSLQPETIVYFAGSTNERTKLYTRILKMYYSLFKAEFLIYGVIGAEKSNKTLPFDPKSTLEYLAFLIKRIN